MEPLKIALVGKKAAGKTFVAHYLHQKYHFKRVKLQYGVDRLVKMFYGMERHKRPSWEQRLYFYDALYKIDPGIHIGLLLKRMETTTMHAVVDDVRYINEVEALAKIGFTIVRVTTEDDTRRRRIGRGLLKAAAGSVILTEYFNTDPSRAYQVDYNIINTTREATRLSIDSLIDRLVDR